MAGQGLGRGPRCLLRACAGGGGRANRAHCMNPGFVDGIVVDVLRDADVGETARLATHVFLQGESMARTHTEIAREEGRHGFASLRTHERALQAETLDFADQADRGAPGGEPQRADALHASVLLVAEPDRELVLSHLTRRDQPRRLHFGERPGQETDALHPRAQQGSQADQVEVRRSSRRIRQVPIH